MKHILFTLKGCPFSLCDDESHIRNMLVNAATMGRCTLLDVSSHKFDPYGVTAIALLAESHISIHTWPEKCMAVCDVFTCGDTATPQDGVEYMKDQLKATDIICNEFERPLE